MSAPRCYSTLMKDDPVGGIMPAQRGGGDAEGERRVGGPRQLE